MSGESLLTRIMCSVARVDQHKFRSGYLNTDERKKLRMALSNIVDSPLVIDDRFEKKLGQLKKRIKQAVKDDCCLAIVDQMSLVGSSRRDGNRQAEVSEAMRELKLEAEDDGIPLIVVNQICRIAETRAGTHGRPQLSDLKESGAVEETANTVLLIYREELHNKDRADIHGKAEIIVAKQRNGSEGVCEVRWLGQFSRFEDYDDQTGGPDQPEYIEVEDED